LPERGVVRPLSAHEFDASVVARLDFDRRGFLIAERDGEIVGFAHAGFGPDHPEGASHRLDLVLGTVAMLVVDPEADESEVGARLLDLAERHLREQGAQVLYAGGQYPLDPFYRAIYGGSEWSGILDRHEAFRRVVEAAGYGEVARSTLLDLDVECAEVRDPKAAILRRQTRLEVVEDARPSGWWDALAIGDSSINRYRLLGKVDGVEVARASTWDMSAFGRFDGNARVGLRGVEVAPGHRRKGFGRHLVHEILRHVRSHCGEVVSVTTNQNNTPALALYQAVGFEAVGSAMLYRKAGG